MCIRDRGYPSKSGYLPVVGLSACKWLQIGTAMLLVITSTDDELLRNVSIDDFKWSWTLKILVFSEFLAIFGYKRVNCDEMDGDRPRLGLLANRNCYKLSRISWALAHISCSICQHRWPWTTKKEVWWIVRNFWLQRIFQQWMVTKRLKIGLDQDNQRTGTARLVCRASRALLRLLVVCLDTDLPRLKKIFETGSFSPILLLSFLFFFFSLFSIFFLLSIF